MAKQTFTTGQVLTAAQMTSLQQTAMGGGSATAKTASYTLLAADAGTTVIMNSASATTITVNTSLFAAGDTVLIVNQGAGVCTVTAGTATVSTAGSLALSQYETGILYFTSTSAAIFSDYTQSSSATTAAGCSLTKSANQTLSNATATAVTFDGENFDTDSFHDNSTNTSRITIPVGKGGKYIVSARATYASNITDQRRIQFRVNGSATAIDLFTSSTGVAGEPFTIQTTRFLSLTVGDYVEMFAYQASGGNLTLYGDSGAGTGVTFFGAMFIGA